MSEYIITNKTIALIIVASVIIAAIVGFICYNFGLSYGLEQTPTAETQQPLAETSNLANEPLAPVEQPATDPGAETEPVEITISGEPVTFKGKNILNGTIDQLSANGFALKVTIQTLEPTTRTFSSKTNTYQIIINSNTKIIEQISQITIPTGGGEPKISTSTKNLKFSDLTVNQEITLTTGSQLTASNILAEEIKITTNIRK